MIVLAQIKHRRRKRDLTSKIVAVAKPGVAALLVAGVAVGSAIGITQTGLSGGFEIVKESKSQDEVEGLESLSSEPDFELETLYIVHVDGAVPHPGVYELYGSDLRIRDAVEAAGGLLEGADTSGVNLAAPVVDGSKVHIPTAEEVAAQVMGSSQGTSSAGMGTTSLVNINSATLEQLCTLSGIGEATAANIIADREQNGPFTCIEDLMRVSGIGERKFERVKDSICV